MKIYKTEKGLRFCPTCQKWKLERFFCNPIIEPCKFCYTASAKEAGVRRREREKSLPNTITKKEWNETLIAFKHKCAYCGKPWENKDHFIPIIKNGGNVKENIVPACAKCNRKKWTKTPEEFCSSEEYERIVRILLY